MTEPVDISQIIPKKWKPAIGLIGSFLTFAVPFILSVQSHLPAGWVVAIGAVLAVLTSLGIYKAPYKPGGTVLAPHTPEVVAAATQAATPAEQPSAPTQPPVTPWRPPSTSGGYQNPWRA